MRHRMVPHFATDAVEANVGNVVLSTGVKTTANFHIEGFDGGVERPVPRDDALAQFRRQSPRGGDAQLTSICPRAGGNIRQGRCPALPQTGGDKVRVERWQISLADPAQQEVLCYGRARSPAVVAPGDSRERAHLLGPDVTQRETDSDYSIARLPLRIDIGLEPGLKTGRIWG